MKRTLLLLLLCTACLLLPGQAFAAGEVYLAAVPGNPGFFLVNTVPGGGTVSLDGVAVGTAPLRIAVDPDGTTGHMISVTRPGYLTWMQRFPSNPAPGETIVVTAELKPEVLTGNIQVNAHPLDAIAILDGRESRSTPAIFTGLSPGYHTLVVRRDGFLPLTTTVNVEAGKVADIQASLTDLSTTGNLDLNSEPVGADIAIDGVHVGRTPWSGRLSPGNHTISLTRDNYLTWEGSAVIQNQKTTTLTPTLIPSADSGIGVIAVQSNPPGATIYLDGEVRGETSIGGAVNLPEIPRGPHTLTLRRPGHADYTQVITVYAGQMTHLTADLVPGLPAAATTGIIEIRSVPAGAAVMVDSVSRGVTPVTLKEVTPGTHTVSVSLSGFSTWNGNVTAKPGQTSMVSAMLDPVPVPTTRPPLSATVVITSLVLLLLLDRRRKP